MSKTVTIRYGKIPAYRGNGRTSWGFAISDENATDHFYEKYTCSRPRAKNIWSKLKKNAEDRGYQVALTIDANAELNADLTRK